MLKKIAFLPRDICAQIVTALNTVKSQQLPGFDYVAVSLRINGDLDRISLGKEEKVISKSITKTIVALLLGIAMKKYNDTNPNITINVNTTLNVFFPKSTYLDTLKQVSIADLLTMRTGFEWNEESVDHLCDNSDVVRAYQSSCPPDYLFNKDFDNENNGTRFLYNSGNTMVVGRLIEILLNNSGIDLSFSAFSKRELFAPLDIVDSDWEFKCFDNKTNIGFGGGLCITANAMIRIGQFLSDQVADIGESLIDIDTGWIKDQLSNQLPADQVPATNQSGYGYFTWQVPIKHTHASVTLPAGLGAGGKVLLFLNICPKTSRGTSIRSGAIMVSFSNERSGMTESDQWKLPWQIIDCILGCL